MIQLAALLSVVVFIGILVFMVAGAKGHDRIAVTSAVVVFLSTFLLMWFTFVVPGIQYLDTSKWQIVTIDIDEAVVVHNDTDSP
jgi:uncharacterized membrane protein